MNKKSLMTNFKVMFTMYVLLVLFVIMFLFSFPIRVNALESSQFGDSISTIVIDSLTSTSSYTYNEYNSDTIKDKVFTWSNEKFFENTYTQEKFFSHYNYVVMAYDSTTIRVFVQNYDLILDYQGLTPIESEDIKFYFANMTYQYTEGLYSQYRGGVSLIYSYYIDINYNSDTYTISDNNPLLDLSFYSLATGSKYRNNGNSSDRTYLNLNMRLFDSYNNNFAWIQNFYTVLNTETLWNQVAGSTPSKSSYYYNSPIEFPTLEYVSSGATPDDDSGDSETPSWVQDILDKFDDNNTSNDEINEKLEGIGGVITGIGDWLEETYTTAPLEILYKKFIVEDFGEENFFLMIIDYLDSLSDSINTCEPIVIDIPFLNTADKITLPCMTDIYEDISPSFLEFYQLITTGLISFFIILNVYDTITILLDPTTDLWHSNRSNSDIVRVNSKTGEVID